MPVRTCLFDLGDVLVRFCHDRMCRQIGALCGRDANSMRELLIDSGLQWDFERGLVNESGFHARLQRETGQLIDLPALRLASADIFEPQPGIEALIGSLASRTRLVLFSNTCITHFEFVRERFPLLDHFDAFVLSYDVGSVKPEPGIYEAALARIGCEPGECFYTDDRPENVEAGREFGLDAELFTGVDGLQRHLATRKLPGLAA